MIEAFWAALGVGLLLAGVALTVVTVDFVLWMRRKR